MDISEPVTLSEVLKKWQGLIDKTDIQNTSVPLDQYVSQMTGVNKEMTKELESVCGLETLDCEGELEHVQDKMCFLPQSIHMQTLTANKKLLDRLSNDKNGQLTIYRSRKYKFMVPDIVHSLEQDLKASESSVDISSDLLIRIKVYKPYKRLKNYPTFITEAQEWDVLGSQQLTELRDVIGCLNDYCVPGEYSENLELTPDIRMKDVYKSGFFFFEGIFYVDMRDPGNRDYSKTIRDWAADPKRGLGPFETRQMEGHTFLDLTLKLGQPYVYFHQADCEHVLVVADVRLVHKDDCQDRSLYPLLVNRIKEKRLICRACLTNTATWVTEGSPLAPEDPCFFCDICLKNLHYDADGNKLMEFKAYPYVNKALASEGYGVAAMPVQRPDLKNEDAD